MRHIIHPASVGGADERLYGVESMGAFIVRRENYGSSSFNAFDNRLVQLEGNERSYTPSIAARYDGLAEMNVSLV